VKRALTTPKPQEDPFYDPAAYFRPLTEERLAEIRALRKSWRLNETGIVTRTEADRYVQAVEDLLDEVARVRGQGG
jgi:hypothetical protein